MEKFETELGDSGRSEIDSTAFNGWLASDKQCSPHIFSSLFWQVSPKTGG
jgi:hypothetical protein